MHEVRESPASKRVRAASPEPEVASMELPPLNRASLRPRPDVISLTSVQSFLKQLDASNDPELVYAVRQGIFLGCHSNRYSCLTHEGTTYLVDNWEFSRGLAHQMAYILLGRFDSFAIAPTPLHSCLQIFQEHNPTVDLEVDSAVAVLVSHRAMLWEYWKIKITEAATVDALPVFFPQYYPPLFALPRLLYNLAETVEYSEEEACFADVATALAAFYALDPDYFGFYHALDQRCRVFTKISLNDLPLERARQHLVSTRRTDLHIFGFKEPLSGDVAYVVEEPDRFLSSMRRTRGWQDASEVLLVDRPVSFFCIIDLDPGKYPRNQAFQNPEHLPLAIEALKQHISTQWRLDTGDEQDHLASAWHVTAALPPAPSRVSARVANPSMRFRTPRDLALFTSRLIRRLLQDQDNASLLRVSRSFIGDDMESIVDARHSAQPLLRLPPLSSEEHVLCSELLLSDHSFSGEASGFAYPHHYDPLPLSENPLDGSLQYHTPAASPHRLAQIMQRCIFPAFKDARLRLVIQRQVPWIRAIPIFPSLKQSCE